MTEEQKKRANGESIVSVINRVGKTWKQHTKKKKKKETRPLSHCKHSSTQYL